MTNEPQADPAADFPAQCRVDIATWLDIHVPEDFPTARLFAIHAIAATAVRAVGPGMARDWFELPGPSLLERLVAGMHNDTAIAAVRDEVIEQFAPPISFGSHLMAPEGW